MDFKLVQVRTSKVSRVVRASGTTTSLVRRHFSTCLWLFHELVCLWGINSTSRLGLTRTTSRFSLSSSYPQTIQHHGTSRMSLTFPTWYYDTRRDLNYASDSFLCRFRSSRRKTHGSSIVPQPFVGYIKYSSSSLDCYCSFVVMYLSCGTSFTDITRSHMLL